MKVLLLGLLCATVLFVGAPGAALAWDPFGGDEPPPVPDDSPTTDPSPYIAPPSGIYYVTDTYVADVVTVDGALTTYSTSTVHESTGSYARVLDTVATGDQSVFDGAAFNGRSSLTDGRAVAGTYYENFVLTADGFVPVSVVFFQDDAELARLKRESGPSSRSGGTGGSSSESRPASASEDRPSASMIACCDSAGPRETRDRAETVVRVPVRPGVSLEPASASLSRIEVLRGRPIALWARANAGGREIPVESWAIVSGEAGNASVLSGGGAVPFRTSWDRLPLPGSSYELRFRIVVDTPETGRAVSDAALSVLVRSPALGE